jgi:hypothetical protein
VPSRPGTFSPRLLNDLNGSFADLPADPEIRLGNAGERLQ